MLEKIPVTPTDEELIEVLSAISIVSLRLAKKLDEVSRKNKPYATRKNAGFACPMYEEWRMRNETL